MNLETLRQQWLSYTGVELAGSPAWDDSHSDYGVSETSTSSEISELLT